MSNPVPFRSIPSVDRLLRSEDLAHLDDLYPRSTVVRWVREAIQEYRTEVSAGKKIPQEKIANHIHERVLHQEKLYRGDKIRPVINATGILLHTNLGRAPLAERAIERLTQAAGASNVELNLHSGNRNHRGDHCVELLQGLTGCEDAVLVNNCAAATMMVLQTTAQGREVIISRGQLVEIGGGFRLPDVFRSAGVQLKEIGTTNRTYVADYESAVTDQTAAVMRVHHSNYQINGFATEPTIADLVQMKRSKKIAVIDDLGSGWLGTQFFGPTTERDSVCKIQEPSVAESISAGADLTLFSGDKLLGGPQCGIILGKRHWIEPLRKSALMRAMRLDKLTLAALEATLEIHLEGKAKDELPIIQMLSEEPKAIEDRCKCLEQELSAQIGGDRIDVIACESQIGGGSVPGMNVSSFGLLIRTQKPQKLATRLRRLNSPIQARVTKDAVLLDLRTVPSNRLDLLREGIETALNEEVGAREQS
ncbi:MAG: L-seryl-tRNA(Sec) selenium transferase [Rubripirellula sp.]